MKKYVLFTVAFYFPRSILATSFWIPSERTLIMWCSYAKARRSPPITWGISWATWLRVRVAFFTLTKKIIIFYSTNLISLLITGSRRSYESFFGQYQIEGASPEQAKRDRMRVLSGRFLHIIVLEPDTGLRFLSQSSNVKVPNKIEEKKLLKVKVPKKLLSIFTNVRKTALD